MKISPLAVPDNRPSANSKAWRLEKTRHSQTLAKTAYWRFLSAAKRHTESIPAAAIILETFDVV
jgi:hypothetical protein